MELLKYLYVQVYTTNQIDFLRKLTIHLDIINEK
jgi:hypothetical protein